MANIEQTQSNPDTNPSENPWLAQPGELPEQAAAAPVAQGERAPFDFSMTAEQEEQKRIEDSRLPFGTLPEVGDQPIPYQDPSERAFHIPLTPEQRQQQADQDAALEYAQARKRGILGMSRSAIRSLMRLPNRTRPVDRPTPYVAPPKQPGPGDPFYFGK